MPSKDYDTKDPRKDPALHELFFSDDHYWPDPSSGTWHPIPLNAEKPPEEQLVPIRQRPLGTQQWVSSVMESYTFHNTGEVFPPTGKRVWLKYVLSHVIIRMGGMAGCLYAANPSQKIIRVEFRVKQVSLKKATEEKIYYLAEMPRPMRIVHYPIANYYAI